MSESDFIEDPCGRCGRRILRSEHAHYFDGAIICDECEGPVTSAARWATVRYWSRWVACIPFAIIGGILASILIGLLGWFVNQDSWFNERYLQLISSGVGGWTTIVFAGSIAPDRKKYAGLVALGALLLLGGIGFMASTIKHDWWGVFQLLVMLVAGVCAAVQGYKEEEQTFA